jgi:hypothetical protein
MSTVTIHLPGPLEARLAERIKALGAKSPEEYLLNLVEYDCASETLEQVLAERMDGPFAPLESDWKNAVRFWSKE